MVLFIDSFCWFVSAFSDRSLLWTVEGMYAIFSIVHVPHGLSFAICSQCSAGGPQQLDHNRPSCDGIRFLRVADCPCHPALVSFLCN